MATTVEKVTLMSRPAATQVGLLEVDASITETHTSTNTLTKHPVEEGSPISDHSRPEPDGLVMECLISETPLTREQMQRAIDSGASNESDPTPQFVPGYAKFAYDVLQGLRGQLLTVITGLRSYGSGDSQKMAITALSFPRSVATVNCLRFSITLETVRVVRNKLTRTAPSKDKRRKKQDAGVVTPQDEGDASQNSSILHDLFAAAKGA